MTSILQLALPAALAAYCIARAVKRPIFLLGIPFLQVMRESVFFGGLRPFWMPGRLGPNGAILLWLVLAWTWSVLRSRSYGRSREMAEVRDRPRILPEEYLLLALAALVLGKLVWSGPGPVDTSTLMDQFAPWALLLVGYCLVRGVVSRSTSKDVGAFVLAVAIVTGIGSLLFILHQGLRLPIYSVTEYMVFAFKGRELSRTFVIIPPFLFIALAVGYAKRSWDPVAILLVGMSWVAVVVSYTRSLLLAAAAVSIVLLTLRALKDRRGGALLRRLSMIGVVGSCVVVTILLVLPTSTDYFLSRAETLTSVSTAANDENVAGRQARLSTVTSAVSDRFFFVGAPFGEKGSLDQQVSSWTADSAWVAVVYRTGFVGTALVVGTFVLFGIRACGMFWRSSGTTAFLGAVYVGGITASLVVSFASWTFLDPSFYAMGFWLFAFVAGGANFPPARPSPRIPETAAR